MRNGLRLSACTHPGKVRTANEDCLLVGRQVLSEGQLELTLDLRAPEFLEFGFLCAVADGMGGYAGGALASRTLLQLLSNAYYQASHAGRDASAMAGWLEDQFNCVKESMGAALLEHEVPEAGATLAGLILLPNGEGLLFHCGDARIYRGSGGYVRPLTVDHSPLAADIANGLLDEQTAALSPYANRVSRALGLVGNSDVELATDLCFDADDRFLVCSDGLSGLGRGLPVTELRRLVYEDTPVKEEAPLAGRLVQRALEVDGSDNISVIAVEIWGEPEEPSGNG